MRVAAIAFGLTALSLTVATLALDKSLPYRIGPDHYRQYLWVGPLAGVALVVSVVAILFAIVTRRWLACFLGLLAIASLVLFMGGAHSGPNPELWCYLELRRIDLAKTQLARELGLTNGAAVPVEGISRYKGSGPIELRCVRGGRIVIGNIGEEPRCSFHGSMSEVENALHTGNPDVSAARGKQDR